MILIASKPEKRGFWINTILQIFLKAQTVSRPDRRLRS
jgi:hypothetical protein